MKARPDWTKGDVHDALTIERKAVTWTVGGRTVTAKPCKDGRGGYWIKAANIARAAWVRRVESCFDCEGIAAFLASVDAQAARLWTFDRHGNAQRYTNA
jgi:hypothetical protein